MLISQEASEGGRGEGDGWNHLPLSSYLRGDVNSITVQWVSDNVAPASSEHLNHQCNKWHAVKDIEVAPLADIHCGIVIERKVDGVTG